MCDIEHWQARYGTARMDPVPNGERFEIECRVFPLIRIFQNPRFAVDRSGFEVPTPGNNGNRDPNPGVVGSKLEVHPKDILAFFFLEQSAESKCWTIFDSGATERVLEEKGFVSRSTCSRRS